MSVYIFEGPIHPIMLKTLRLHLSKTQVEMAKFCCRFKKTGPASWRNWETGRYVISARVEQGLKRVCLELLGCELHNIQGQTRAPIRQRGKTKKELFDVEDFKYIRDNQGVSNKDIAILLKTTPVMVKRWENGTCRPGPDKLRKIKALVESDPETVQNLLNKINTKTP
jgi:DNA-binding transcriptional regulator YiaG